jgi:hypothetical protein
MIRHWLPAILSVTILGLTQARLYADEKDPLPAVRDRMKIEAQRVEKVFAEDRAAAYKLVRSDSPKLSEAIDKLEALLALIRKDTSLEERRRKVLIVTLEWDLGKVAEIAGERRRSSSSSSLSRETRSSTRQDYGDRRADDRRGTIRDARSIIESRSRSIADSRSDRGRSSDRYNRVMRSVDDAAVPDSRNYVLPRDWLEKSKKRGSGIKMTAKERAIMAALKATITVDYPDTTTLEDAIDSLRKLTKCEIVIDKRGLDEANVTYKSQVNLKMTASTRTVLKRILGELGLAYVVKDEAILITSAERARQMTTTRTYYIGDLAAVVDIRIPPAINQLLMIQTVNRLIEMITSNIDRASWKVNNPDAPGAIYFDPLTMSLVVKQTAEIHFMLGGK